MAIHKFLETAIERKRFASFSFRQCFYGVLCSFARSSQTLDTSLLAVCALCVVYF